MLGEKLGDEHGQVTSRRVLPGDDFRYIKMEISFESEITILGKSGQNIGTYTVFERVHDQIYAEGQGICMFSDGSSAIWNGHGIGQASEDGGIAVAASIAFQAGAGLERLNGVLGLVEHHAHADGHIHSDIYEWKATAH